MSFPFPQGGISLLRLRQAVRDHGIEAVHSVPISIDLVLGLTTSVAASLGITDPGPTRTCPDAHGIHRPVRRQIRTLADHLKMIANTRYRKAASHAV